MMKPMTQGKAWMMGAVLALAGWLGGTPAHAQGLDIDIVNGTASALPIAVVPFGFEGASLPPDANPGEIVRADLARSGQFRALPKADIVEFPTREAEVKFATWRLLKQDFLVVGRMSDAGGGAIRVEYELFDVARQQRLADGAISGQRSGLRDVAHQIADIVYEKILGVRGAFWTRIAYITATGSPPSQQYALMVADSDGYNPQVVVRSREALLSPAWSPDGRRLAYVSFESGNSAIYVQDLATGARQVVSSSRGITTSTCSTSAAAAPPSSPAISPSTPSRSGHPTGSRSISPPTARASRRSTRCRPAAAIRRGSPSRASTTPARASSTRAASSSPWCRATETCIVLRFLIGPPTRVRWCRPAARTKPRVLLPTEACCCMPPAKVHAACCMQCQPTGGFVSVSASPAAMYVNLPGGRSASAELGGSQGSESVERLSSMSFQPALARGTP